MAKKVPKPFKPAFIGGTATHLAAWLKNKPDWVDLEGEFFFFGELYKAAAGGKDGARNEEGDKVVLWRIGDREGQGDTVHCVLTSAEESTPTLGRMEYGAFDQLIERKGEYVPEI